MSYSVCAACCQQVEISPVYMYNPEHSELHLEILFVYAYSQLANWSHHLGLWRRDKMEFDNMFVGQSKLC